MRTIKACNIFDCVFCIKDEKTETGVCFNPDQTCGYVEYKMPDVPIVKNSDRIKTSSDLWTTDEYYLEW
jgi:hypothetical protein